MLQRLRLCRTSDTVFRREIDSRRQWGNGTCYGDSFPSAKECILVCEWPEICSHDVVQKASEKHSMVLKSLTFINGDVAGFLG